MLNWKESYYNNDHMGSRAIVGDLHFDISYRDNTVRAMVHKVYNNPRIPAKELYYKKNLSYKNVKKELEEWYREEIGMSKPLYSIVSLALWLSKVIIK